MASYQISNPNNINYISNNTNNNIISPKRISKSPLIYHNNRINYGEKIQEKKNYLLYVSSSGHRPKYEKRQKIKKYENKINLNKNLNYNLYEEEEEDNNILSSSDNYKYKETKNIKMENPNYKIITIHKRLGSPRQSQRINSPKKSKKIKIKKIENMFWQKEYAPSHHHINTNKNEKIRILRESKSSDYFQPIKKRIQNDDNNDYNEYTYNNYRIINEDSHIETTKDGDYFIKITKKRKEIQPNNYNNYNNRNVKYINKNGKHIKVIRYNEPLYANEENFRNYNKKYINRNNYENEPYYIGNYGEEGDNYESSVKYNKKNNYKYQENEEYVQEEQEDNEFQNQKYMNMEDDNEYEYDNNIIYNQEDQEYLDDIKSIKDIVCPLHGKISIIIHKNPFNNN